jgi:hypothetical protein
MGAVGRELPEDSTEKPRVSPTGGAESGALGDDLQRFDPDLRAVIDAWPNLSGDAKASILSIIRAVNQRDGNE